VAWKASCPTSPSSSSAVSSGGMMCDRPCEAAEAAVEGRWALYAAIWASERAVRVRPGCAVSPQHLQRNGSRTSSVRRMLLDFAAQLGHVCPAAGASSFVQLLYVAAGLFALGRVLCCCKLPTPTMTLLGPRDSRMEYGRLYLQPL
jgi:hypothetical protein